MVRMTAARASAHQALMAHRKLRNHMNATWALQPKCRMFTKKPIEKKNKDKTQKPPSRKKLPVRTNRLINGHAWKVVASGAATYVNSVLAFEGKTFRISAPKESTRCPWLPSLTPGAIALIEGFLCAYAQQATRNAMMVRKALGATNKKGEFVGQKRLNGKLMRMGFDEADAAIFGASSLAPRSIIVTKPLKKKDKAKDDDFTPDPTEPTKA